MPPCVRSPLTQYNHEYTANISIRRRWIIAYRRSSPIEFCRGPEGHLLITAPTGRQRVLPRLGAVAEADRTAQDTVQLAPTRDGAPRFRPRRGPAGRVQAHPRPVREHAEISARVAALLPASWPRVATADWVREHPRLPRRRAGPGARHTLYFGRVAFPAAVASTPPLGAFRSRGALPFAFPQGYTPSTPPIAGAVPTATPRAKTAVRRAGARRRCQPCAARRARSPPPTVRASTRRRKVRAQCRVRGADTTLRPPQQARGRRQRNPPRRAVRHAPVKPARLRRLPTSRQRTGLPGQRHGLPRACCRGIGPVPAPRSVRTRSAAPPALSGPDHHTARTTIQHMRVDLAWSTSSLWPKEFPSVDVRTAFQ